MIEDGLYTILKDNETIAALVGARIWPNRLPQGVVLPAVRYRRISAVAVGNSHDGQSDLTRARFEFAAHADSYDEARAVVAGIMARLKDFQGTLGGQQVYGTWIDNDIDGWMSDTQDHVRMVDVIFLYDR